MTRLERLRTFPLELGEANDLVRRLHRHHKPVLNHRFSQGCMTEEGRIAGAAICGRPVARVLDQRLTLEVNRCVTDGTPNACSFLYGVCARIAQERGFIEIQTYILESEPGTSLKAAGWSRDGPAGGGDWNRPSRGGRRLDQPLAAKVRWSRRLNPPLPGPRNAALAAFQLDSQPTDLPLEGFSP